jgi:hypothetical protein
MKNEPRHRDTGGTIGEYASAAAEELEIDAVGLWQIVPVGRNDFGLDGESLADFVRQNLLALFAKGAKPVIGRKGVDHWILKDDYGTTPAQMADAVIEEWRASGAKDPKPYDSLWFALPKMYEELP